MNTVPKQEHSQQNAQQRFTINNRPASNFAALVIQQPLFWGYLHAKTGWVVNDSGSADTLMKKLIGVSSKKEIDRDEFALYRFNLMFNDYRATVNAA